MNNSSCLLSQLRHLGQATSKWTTDERDSILVTLSQVLSILESEPNDQFNEQLCREMDIVTSLVTLIQVNDQMVTYLSTNILSRLLCHHADLFQGNILTGTNKSTLLDNYAQNGLLLSFLETIYLKMKKDSDPTDAIHSVYMDVINTSLNFTCGRFSSYSECTVLNISEVINLANLCLLLLKIIKSSSCTHSSLVDCQSGDLANSGDFSSTQQYIELLEYFHDFLNGIVSGNRTIVDNNPIYILWRILIKSLLKILDISVHSKDAIMSKESLCLCQKMCSVLHLHPFQSKLVFIESGFGGPVDNVYNRNNVFVMDEVTGRRLILFLLKTLHLSNVDELTPDHIDLTLSSSLYLLNKFHQVKNQDVQVVQQLMIVFVEQDDQLVDVVYILFKIYVSVRRFPITILQAINPHVIFFRLVHSISFDESVLLDWLVSTESKLFSCYMKQYLLMVQNEFQLFLFSIKGISDVTVPGSPPTKCSALTVPTDTTTSVEPVDGGDSYPDIINFNLRIVDYSSSSSDDDEQPAVAKSATVDQLFSCLIRLNLKLDRLKTQNLLQEELDELVVVLDDVEYLYEASL